MLLSWDRRKKKLEKILERQENRAISSNKISCYLFCFICSLVTLFIIDGPSGYGIEEDSDV